MSTTTAKQTESLIDLEHDELRPVAVICHRKTGKRPSPACIWRWRIKGSRGVKLEAVYLQGTWQTTDAAFAAFIRGQTAAANAACTAADVSHERDETTERRLKAARLL